MAIYMMENDGKLCSCRTVRIFSLYYNGSLKRLAKLRNLQHGQCRPRKKKIQIAKIRNERGDIITDLTEIKRIIREYYAQFCASKFYSLDEKSKFLEKYKLPN